MLVFESTPPSTWLLGEGAVTQTWHVCCGLVGCGGTALHVNVSLKLKSEEHLTLCTFPVAYLKHMHTLSPLWGRPWKEICCFLNKENTASIHLGLQTQVHTHTQITLYIFFKSA